MNRFALWMTKFALWNLSMNVQYVSAFYLEIFVFSRTLYSGLSLGLHITKLSAYSKRHEKPCQTALR